MYLHVETDTGNDTLMVGVAGSIVFRADSAEGSDAVAFSWPLLWSFSNGNVVGPIDEATNVEYASYTTAVFETISWDSTYGATVTNPDTTLLGLFDNDGNWWTLSHEVWRINFVPTDTGRITIDSVTTPFGGPMTVAAPFGNVAFRWESKTVTVVPFCAISLTGDVNSSQTLNAADIIALVNFLFRSGPMPTPCVAAGDVDCSGDVSIPDIIRLVDFVFKGAESPCDVCSLIWSGAWTCN